MVKQSLCLGPEQAHSWNDYHGQLIAETHLQEEVPKAEGLISYQKVGTTSPEDRQQLFVAFSEADLKSRGLRFSRGDMVEFVLGSDPKTGRQTASQVAPAPGFSLNSS